mgnify:CR=1 FL=1
MGPLRSDRTRRGRRPLATAGSWPRAARSAIGSRRTSTSSWRVLQGRRGRSVRWRSRRRTSCGRAARRRSGRGAHGGRLVDRAAPTSRAWRSVVSSRQPVLSAIVSARSQDRRRRLVVAGDVLGQGRRPIDLDDHGSPRPGCPWSDAPARRRCARRGASVGPPLSPRTTRRRLTWAEDIGRNDTTADARPSNRRSGGGGRRWIGARGWLVRRVGPRR